MIRDSFSSQVQQYLEAGFDQQELLRILPHRPPMVWLDKISNIDLDLNTLSADFFVDPKLDCFKGHFPHLPLFPGVFQLEMIAQASGVLALVNALSENYSQSPLQDTEEIFHLCAARSEDSLLCLSEDRTRVLNPIFPENQIQIDVKFIKSTQINWTFSAMLSVEGKACCRSKIILTEIPLSKLKAQGTSE